MYVQAFALSMCRFLHYLSLRFIAFELSNECVKGLPFWLISGPETVPAVPYLYNQAEPVKLIRGVHDRPSACTRFAHQAFRAGVTLPRSDVEMSDDNGRDLLGIARQSVSQTDGTVGNGKVVFAGKVWLIAHR